MEHIAVYYKYFLQGNLKIQLFYCDRSNRTLKSRNTAKTVAILDFHDLFLRRKLNGTLYLRWSSTEFFLRKKNLYNLRIFAFFCHSWKICINPLFRLLKKVKIKRKAKKFTNLSFIKKWSRFRKIYDPQYMEILKLYWYVQTYLLQISPCRQKLASQVFKFRNM